MGRGAPRKQTPSKTLSPAKRQPAGRAVPSSSWGSMRPRVPGTVKCFKSAPHTSLPQQSLPVSLFVRLRVVRPSHTERLVESL